MSGHSKWANIKHRKQAADKVRGKLFSKAIKDIILSAKRGGGNPETNNALKAAITYAKSVNVPMATIEKAIKKGTGELKGESPMEEITYEGYGPKGVAVIVKVLTDNKNRTVSELRHIFTKHNSSLGESGCVSWMFHEKGYIQINAENIDKDRILNDVIESGGEDMVYEGNIVEVYTSVAEFNNVLNELRKRNYKIITSEISLIPQTTIKLEGDDAINMLKLMDALDDHDDVQKVFANFDIESEIMEKIIGQN